MRHLFSQRDGVSVDAKRSIEPESHSALGEATRGQRRRIAVDACAQRDIVLGGEVPRQRCFLERRQAAFKHRQLAQRAHKRRAAAVAAAEQTIDAPRAGAQVALATHRPRLAVDAKRKAAIRLGCAVRSDELQPPLADARRFGARVTRRAFEEPTKMLITFVPQS